MDRTPIFFLVTRSFWAFVATIALILDQGEPMVRALVVLAAAVCASCGIDVNAVTLQVMEIAPLATLIIAMWQRSGGWGAGEARPYTLRPAPETLR